MENKSEILNSEFSSASTQGTTATGKKRSLVDLLVASLNGTSRPVTPDQLKYIPFADTSRGHDDDDYDDDPEKLERLAQLDRELDAVYSKYET